MIIRAAGVLAVIREAICHFRLDVNHLDLSIVGAVRILALLLDDSDFSPRISHPSLERYRIIQLGNDVIIVIFSTEAFDVIDFTHIFSPQEATS